MIQLLHIQKTILGVSNIFGSLLNFKAREPAEIKQN